ncbi:methyl-accepting chemotaxis protein [Shimia sp. R10_1]|uniref:methyl-accepting chemotaxis protein n=1 Tax=Shimia sp. R10_1 TaxID=2821095 RepID=UPI001ADB0F97|nr:methyl-accepting chemotaxis protein [Shimia sp. R10_1]MBO9474237.1 methyl-accepting chemotaxis protein [Shimia sp. R10_1]
MKLRVVMLFVIGPIFALAGFLMYGDVTSQRAVVESAHDTTMRAQEGAIVGHVIHELQKERGYSAGFIASQGKNFSAELKEQREHSSAAIESFQQQIDLLAMQRPELLSKISTRLTALEAMRDRVDGLQLRVPETASFYTQTINHLIDFSRPSGISDTHSQVQALLSARVLIGSAKESAGLERAMGATGLGGGFSTIVHDRFVELGGAQGALLLEASGALDDAGWLATLRETAEFKAVQNARETVRSGYELQDYDGLTAPNWFKISTAWINILRAEELRFVEQIADLTLQIEAAADARFNRMMWLGMSVMLLVLSFAIFSFERMVARIKYLIAVINEFTSGNFDVFVEGIEGRDELSKMAKAVYHFKQDTLQMRRDAEALKSEQERRKKEQDFVVGEIRLGLGEMAEGNLTHHFETPFPEEYEGLRADFNATVGKLNETLVHVVDVASSIRSGTVKFSQSSDDLSRRTEDQAGTLEQTAAALEGITSSVQSAASGAKDVQESTLSAKNDATESGAIVKEAVNAMAKISESSNQIAQIISVIDDIAFQTNLLALNAGVEAARAGAAGSGFAVVASEVRALAQKSSGAAREIQDLIGESTASVSNGVGLVNETGEALGEIVNRVSHVSALVSNLADGTVSQAATLGEINTGVSQLEEATQRNAVMAQDVSATCATLKEEANELERLVSQFKLSLDGTARNPDRDAA